MMGPDMGLLKHDIEKAASNIGPGREYRDVREYLDTVRKAYLLSQDSLMRNLLGVPFGFKFGSLSSYMQNAEGMLFAFAETINDSSTYFNSVESQAEAKTKIPIESEKEYVKDIVKASQEIADKTRKNEIIAVMRSSLKDLGYDYDSLAQASVTLTEADVVKQQLEQYHGQLYGNSGLHKNDLLGNSKLVSQGDYTYEDLQILLKAKTELQDIFNETPLLRSELQPPKEGTEEYDSKFANFLEQKRFSAGSSVDVNKDELKTEFNYNYADSMISYYSQQVLARYNEELKRSPGAKTDTIWNNVMGSVREELQLGKFVDDYKYRVSDTVCAAVKEFGASIGRDVYDVEIKRDGSGRITELIASSKEGLQEFKISNDNVLPTIELFDYSNIQEGYVASSRLYEFRVGDVALQSATLGRSGDISKNSIGTMVGEKSYKVERRGDWMRWVDYGGTKFLPGHREIAYGQDYKQTETDKNFEETFIRQDNEDGSYTKYYVKAGVKDRDETYLWHLEEEMPVKTIYHNSALGVPLIEIFEGANSMKSKVYLWSEDKGVREENPVYANTYTYDQGYYHRVVKSKDDMITGLHEEWKDVSTDGSAVKYECVTTAANGTVITTKDTSRQRDSDISYETTEYANKNKDAAIIDTETGKETLVRSDFRQNIVYTETSGYGDNAFMRSFIREYADKRPKETGWSNLRTKESELVTYNHLNVPVIITSFGAVNNKTLKQTYERKDSTEQTVVRGEVDALTGADSSKTYSMYDTGNKNPLFKSEVSAVDYNTLRKTVTVSKFRDDNDGRKNGLIEWKEAGFVNPLYGAGNFVKTLGDGRIESVTTGLDKFNAPLRNNDGNYYQVVAYKLLGQQDVVTLNSEMIPVEAVKTTAGGKLVERRDLNLRTNDGSCYNRTEKEDGEVVAEYLTRFNGPTAVKEVYYDHKRTSRTEYGFKKAGDGSAYFAATTLDDISGLATEEQHGIYRDGYIRQIIATDNNTKDKISTLTSNDGVEFYGKNFETKELVTQEALFINGPIVSINEFTPKARDINDTKEIKSKKQITINTEDGSVEAITDFPQTLSSRAETYGFYGGVLDTAVDRGPGDFLVSSKSRLDRDGTKYRVTYYNGDNEKTTLYGPNGPAAGVVASDTRGNIISDTKNIGNRNIITYANGDTSVQFLSRCGGVLESAVTMPPSQADKLNTVTSMTPSQIEQAVLNGKLNVKTFTKAQFVNSNLGWELQSVYPQSNSKHNETKDLLWRDGPCDSDKLASKDGTVVSAQDIVFDQTDNAFHQISHYFGSHDKNTEIRREDYKLLFMNGPLAEGTDTGTIVDYRYKYNPTGVPNQMEEVVYKADINYTHGSGDNYANRTETVYRIENGSRMPSYDSQKSLKLILGTWKPVYIKQDSHDYGELTTSFSYDENKTGLPLGSSVDFIDPTQFNHFQTKTEKLVNLSELKNSLVELKRKQNKTPEDEEIIADDERVIRDAEANYNRVRDEIERLTQNKNNGPAVSIPTEDLFVGIIYDVSKNIITGKTFQGRYLGMNLYLNDSAMGLRQVAQEKVNITSNERDINVIYELANGQTSIHGYNRGTKGFLENIFPQMKPIIPAVDYPVYLTLNDPWANELVSIDQSPLKSEIKFDEVQEFYRLAKKELLWIKAYDAVLSKSYNAKNIVINGKDGSFTYTRTIETRTNLYNAPYEGKELLPQFWLTPMSSLRTALIILGIAFGIPVILKLFYPWIRNFLMKLFPKRHSMKAALSNSNKSPPGNISSESVLAPVEKSKEVFDQWKLLLKGNELSDQDIRDILNKAMLVMKQTPFQIDAAKENLEELHNTYDNMYKLALQTIHSLKPSYDKISADEKERRDKLDVILSEFGFIAQYSVNYASVASSMVNLKVLSGYILPRKNFFELGMSFARFWHGFWYGVAESSERTKERVKQLVDLGNIIQPGLYNDTAKTIQETDNHLNSIEHKKKENGIGGIRSLWKYDRSVPRIIGLITFLYGIFVFVFLCTGAPVSLVISFVFMAIPLLVSWILVVCGLKESYTEKMNSITKALGREPGDHFTETFQKIEYGATVQALEREMGKPSADIILVMATPENMQYYKDLLAGGKGKLWREDIPFEFLPYEGEDEGGAYAGAFDYLTKEKLEDLAQKYPHLKGRKAEDVRSVILVTGQNGKEDIASPVTIPGAEKITSKLGRELMNIEYQLCNGLKGTQMLEDDKGRGGKIFVKAKYHDVGPIQRRGEITLMGSWANLDQVEDQKLKILLETQDGHASKIYHDFKVKDINDKLKRNILGVYDEKNKEIRQMPVLSGIVLFSFDTYEKEREFSRMLDRVPHSFSFTKDVLNPLILLENEGAQEMYKSMTYRDDFKNGQRRALLELYDSYEKEYGGQNKMPFDFRVYMPQVHETYISYGSAQQEIRYNGKYVSKSVKDNVSGSNNSNSDTPTPIQKSQDILSGWKKLLDAKNGDELSDDEIRDILNKAMQIIKLAPFQVNSIIENPKETSNNLMRLYKMYGFKYADKGEDKTNLYTQALRTIRAIKATYNNRKTGPAKRAKLEVVLSEFGFIAQYSANYASLALAMDNLDLLSGYVLEKGTFWEWVMQLVRRCFHFKHGIVRSSRRAQERVQKLVEIGNMIQPGLYQDPGVPIRETDEYIKSIENQKKTGAIAIDKYWKARRAVPRIMRVITIFVTVFSTLLISSGIPSVNFVISFVTGILLSLASSWFLIDLGLHESYALQMRSITKALGREPGDHFTETFQKIEYGATVQALEREMGKPSADIILVMATPENMQYYKDLLAGGKGKLWREDIPFEFLPYEGEDEGGAYAGAFDYLTKEKLEDLAQKYPHLKGRKAEDVRSVILVTGQNGKEDIASPVTIPGAEKITSKLGRELMNIEYQLCNGLKGTQMLEDDKGRGGKIFVKAKYHDVGPIQRRGEITLMGSWANLDQVEDQKLKILLETQDGHASKIYHDFKVKDINDKLKRNILGVYDEKNKEIRQMPVLSGIVLFSFDTYEKEREFSRMLDRVPHSFSFTKDVLNPLILLENEGAQEMYKSMTYRDDFKNGQRRALLELYDSYEKEYGGQNKMPFDFRVYMPQVHETYITFGGLQKKTIIAGVQIAGQGQKTVTDDKQNLKEQPPQAPAGVSGDNINGKLVKNLEKLKEAAQKKNEETKKIHKSAEEIDRINQKLMNDNQAQLAASGFGATVAGASRENKNNSHNDGKVVSESPQEHILPAAIDSLDKVKSPISILRQTTETAEEMAMREYGDVDTSNSLKNKTAIYVFEALTPQIKKQMSVFAGMEMNCLGVSLLLRNSSVERTKLKYIGDIVVPVEGAFLNTGVWAEKNIQDGTVILYLEPQAKQAVIGSQEIVRAFTMEGDSLDQNRQRLLLGRGVLSIVREIKEKGKPEFTKNILDLGLVVPLLDPVLVQMKDFGSVYACPKSIMDDFTNDAQVNSLAYGFHADTFRGSEKYYVPVETCKKMCLNPELFQYLSGDGRYFDPVRMAVLQCDLVTASCNNDREATVEGIDRYPEFSNSICKIQGSRFEDDIQRVTHEYMNILWPGVCERKRSLKYTREYPGAGKLVNMEDVIPSVSFNQFTEIPKISRNLHQAGIRKMILNACSPVISPNNDSAVVGVTSGYGLDLSKIDFDEEAKRLIKGDDNPMSWRIKSLLPDDQMSDLNDSDGLKINQFYVALMLYQEFLRNEREQVEFQEFKKNRSWIEVAKYARYLAVLRIHGFVPKSVTEIEVLMKVGNPQKWELYPNVYEYLCYVASRQLREVIKNSQRSEETRMKIIIPFSMVMAQESADVVNHPAYFKDSTGKIISPVIDGKSRTDLALYSMGEIQARRLEAVESRLKYMFEEYGVDGLCVNGINQYDSASGKETGPGAGQAVLSYVANIIKSFDPDAIIVADKGSVPGVSEILPVGDGQPDLQMLKEKAAKNEKVCFSIMENITPRALENLLKSVAASGLSPYISFAVSSYQFRNGSAAQSEIMNNLKTMCNEGIFTDDELVVKGAILGDAMNVTAKESALIVSRLRKTEKFAFSDGIEVAAPGLHVLLKAYNYIKAYSKEKDPAKLLGKGISQGDVFNKAYSILADAGLTDNEVPVLWEDIRRFHRQANAQTDDKMKWKVHVQFFDYIEKYYGNVLYVQFKASTGTKINENNDAFKQCLVLSDSLIVRDNENNIQVTPPNWLTRESLDVIKQYLIPAGRYQEAKSALRYYAKCINKDGLLPSRISSDGKAEFNAADVSLQFIDALNVYYKYARDRNKGEFVSEMLPVVNTILECYKKASGQIHMDEHDNLICVPAGWTWSGAEARSGKPVEIQGLFYNALCVAKYFNALAGNNKESDSCDMLSGAVKAAINERFFTKVDNYPFDVLDGNDSVPKTADAQNALFLISMSESDDLLPLERKRKIFETARSLLSSPGPMSDMFCAMQASVTGSQGNINERTRYFNNLLYAFENFTVDIIGGEPSDIANRESSYPVLAAKMVKSFCIFNSENPNNTPPKNTVGKVDLRGVLDILSAS